MFRPSLQKEPLQSDPMPSRIFEHMAADYFEVDGRHYLAIVDRYSGWLELFPQTKAPTSASLINDLTRMFCRTGCPTRLFSDGGKQFTAEETQKFLQTWGVSHRLSSPMYPQSNGLAESAVKGLKLLLKKHKNRPDSEAFRKGLLELRNTPRQGGKSPAEIVFGRQLRSSLFCHPEAFDKKWQTSQAEHDKRTAEAQMKAAKIYDRSARQLKLLQIGDHVLIQNTISKEWDRTGIIVQRKDREYKIRLPSGRALTRNRQFLQKIIMPAVEPQLRLNERLDQRLPEKPRKPCLINPDHPRRTGRVRYKPEKLDL